MENAVSYLGLLHAPALHPMAEEVEGTVRAIVDQAAG